jgi:hypothetical protein
VRKTEDVSNSKNFDHCGCCSLCSPDVGFGLLKLSLTAHLGGTAGRLTVNWHWRLIGLL